MAFRDILILTQKNIYAVASPSHCLNEAYPAIETSREEVKTMNLDTGIGAIAQAILAYHTAAMLLVAFCLYVTRDRRYWW